MDQLRGQPQHLRARHTANRHLPQITLAISEELTTNIERRQAVRLHCVIRNQSSNHRTRKAEAPDQYPEPIAGSLHGNIQTPAGSVWNQASKKLPILLHLCSVAAILAKCYLDCITRAPEASPTNGNYFSRQCYGWLDRQNTGRWLELEAAHAVLPVDAYVHLLGFPSCCWHAKFGTMHA